MTRSDPHQARARELAIAAGYTSPDLKILVPGKKAMPAWCLFRQQAREEASVREARELKLGPKPQDPKYANSPLIVLGNHEYSTLEQMKNCLKVGNAVKGVICADGHLGYAQPVGGVIAYEGQISISGVGFDIGCGNMAVRLDTKFADVKDRVYQLTKDISENISFGVGRVNETKAEHALFDDREAWKAADMKAYLGKAMAQLGTVGSGNHYVDLMEDEEGLVWIGVHFGSRGLGHTSATKYLKLAGGKDGINVPPAVVDEHSELGARYIAAMELAGRYAYAGREWVVERVRKMIGGRILETVHNHHNYAWREVHDGKSLWVVRKGATPAFPGQRGFVGGSMGDDAVILEGIDTPEARNSLYSTVHGAGRVMGRKEAKRQFSRETMDDWLVARGVTLFGADLDESPMAYRRLDAVLAYHTESTKVVHRLRPFSVVMAGAGEFDPFKD